LLLALFLVRCRCGAGSVQDALLLAKLLVQGHLYLEAEVVWAVRWVVLLCGLLLANMGSCCCLPLSSAADMV
jgi:hypothetical protein